MYSNLRFVVYFSIACALAFGSAATWFVSTHHCAESHQVWIERSCYNAPMYWIETCDEAHVVTVCDRWEEGAEKTP